jgi:hypothetical protein
MDNVTKHADLAELDFSPLATDESIMLDDRVYLVGAHTDGRVQ